MYDLLQPFCLVQIFGNFEAVNMSLCCLCRLDFTADVGSGHHDSVGQHDEPAGQHSLPGTGKNCSLSPVVQRCKVCMMHFLCDC